MSFFFLLESSSPLPALRGEEDRRRVVNFLVSKNNVDLGEHPKNRQERESGISEPEDNEYLVFQALEYLFLHLKQVRRHSTEQLAQTTDLTPKEVKLALRKHDI